MSTVINDPGRPPEAPGRRSPTGLPLGSRAPAAELTLCVRPLLYVKRGAAESAGRACRRGYPTARTLTLRVTLTSEGERRNAHGEYVGDDGLAHGDVTGDLEEPADARRVLDAACRPPLSLVLSDEQLAGSEPVDLEVVARRQVHQVLEPLSCRYAARPDWLDDVPGRALVAARDVLPLELEQTRARWQRSQQARQAQQRAERSAGSEGDGLPPPETRLEIVTGSSC